MVSIAVHGGDAEGAEQLEETVYAVVTQHAHKRYVQGADNGLVGRNHSAVALVVVLRIEALEVERYVWDKGVGQYHAV